MLPTLIAQLKILLASLATAAISITPVPAQQGITSNTNASANAGSNDSSRNWAGYVATNGPYTSITGTWTVPQVTTSGHTATDATWVGIGGVSSNDLIQAGTQNVINPSGQITTTAFYELLPDASVPINSISIKPGDSVTVSITQQSSGQWLISFNDTTTSQNYQTTISYASSQSSAEWIEEAPSNGINVLPLDNFGTVQFSDGETTRNGSQVSISSSNAHEVTMVNNTGQALATPSALGSDGASFTVSRSNAISNPPIPGYDRNPRGWYRRGRGIGITIQFIRRNHHVDTDDSYPTQIISQQPTVSPAPDASSAGVQIFRRGFHRGFSFSRRFR
jgi:hypothetical protein